MVSVNIKRALVLSIAVLCEGNHFLERGIESEDFQAIPILEELERVLGSDRRMATEGRVNRLEEILRPTFQAMPKDFDGGLRPDAVRYALHRLFVDRHGWYVKGLEPGGAAWNASSPASIFEKHAGSGVYNLFEERLGNHTFNLHHVAVLAATLESFVHAETVERLHAAYYLSGVEKHEEDATEAQVEAVVDTYMMLYVLGRNHSNVTTKMMDMYRKVVHRVYPTWDVTKAWARGVRKEVVHAADEWAPESFLATTRAVEVIADRYGRFQDKECQDIKSMLMEHELGGTGRVPLETFYASALQGNYQFSESVPYLRQLGVLDESDPKWPTVMIANYVNSPSNCVASSKFYEVCCINECEALFGNLEIGIARPDASPARILEMVVTMSSATVKAPRELPTILIQRLDEIAAQYEGTVPLHSRLFAQWMHHAYPRECPYPHLSGTVNPVSMKEYKAATGQLVKVDEDTMREHVEEARQRGVRPSAASDEQSLPWSSEDELLVCRPEVTERVASKSFVRVVVKYAVLLAAILSLMFGLVRSTRTASTTFNGRPQEKFMV